MRKTRELIKQESQKNQETSRTKGWSTELERGIKVLDGINLVPSRTFVLATGRIWHIDVIDDFHLSTCVRRGEKKRKERREKREERKRLRTRSPVFVIKSWRDNWDRLSEFFLYSEAIRKLIYTTNTVEGYHRQIRKVTKSKGVFPNDTALTKLVYLAYRNARKNGRCLSRTGPLSHNSWQ